MDRELPLNYQTAGFNGFIRRSIDSQPAFTLQGLARSTRGSTEINFDNTRASGSLGDVIQVGDIQINGGKRRISIFDGEGNEIVTLGELDG